MSNRAKKLIWKCNEFQVTIIDRPLWIDIITDICGHEVKLFVKYTNNYAYIEDLWGNGYSSGYQCKGIGTLMVNLATQMFKQKLPLDAEVIAQLSDNGDPEDPRLHAQCTHIRTHFWQSFGFQIIANKKKGDQIQSNSIFLTHYKQ